MGLMPSKVMPQFILFYFYFSKVPQLPLSLAQR